MYKDAHVQCICRDVYTFPPLWIWEKCKMEKGYVFYVDRYENEIHYIGDPMALRNLL